MLHNAGSFRLSVERTLSVPLTIGVIADTHVYAHGARRLPPEVPDLFRRFAVGLIVHAGDVNTVAVLAALGEVAPVLAVLGNNHDETLTELLPDIVEFIVGVHKFALIHGHGGATARTEAKRLAGRFDCVVYGHSHIPALEVENGTIIFNPGSATDRRWQEHFGVGLIHVTEEKIDPELVLYHDARHLRNVKPG